MDNPEAPTLTLDREHGLTLQARGIWQVHALAKAGVIARIQSTLEKLPQLLWNAWGKTRPSELVLAPGHDEFFKRLALATAKTLPQPVSPNFLWVIILGQGMLNFFDHLRSFVAMLGQLIFDTWRFVRRPARGPWKEISANIFHAGFQALGITALVGFLIGIVLSYLSAQQLRVFGGDIYLVNLLGMSIIRELGPMLAAILVAGRSGSAVTAQLGVMRVTEELDAMLVMGIPHGFRLIMPKVLALSVAMPLLVIWTDALALIGGMTAAKLELDLSPYYFIQKLPDAVPLANYFIGIGKGVVFGSLIALISCRRFPAQVSDASAVHGRNRSLISASESSSGVSTIPSIRSL